MKIAAIPFFLGCALAAAQPVVTVTQNSAQVGSYDVFELTMTNLAAYANPCEDPAVTAVFTAPSGSMPGRQERPHEGHVFRTRSTTICVVCDAGR